MTCDMRPYPEHFLLNHYENRTYYLDQHCNFILWTVLDGMRALLSRTVVVVHVYPEHVSCSPAMVEKLY